MQPDRNNCDTAWALRSHARRKNPGSKMAFGACSSKVVRWYPAAATTVSKPEAIYIGTGRSETSFGGVIDILEAAAGTASTCLVAYQGRRNVSWRNRTRSQSHLCNGMPSSWDMPNHTQGNGRATGDSKALLKANSGRDYITYLGNCWDHLADLAAESWLEEIASRMTEQGMCLKEAADSQQHSFPPECNFDLGRMARPAKPGQAQTRRQYTAEDLPYNLQLTSDDPNQQLLQKQLDAAAAAQLATRLEHLNKM